MALTRPRYSSIVDTDYKASCRVVTTTNITLSGSAPSSYDGVNLAAGDRILVAGQSTASQNGIYIVQTLGTGSDGTWIRSPDANANDRVTAGMTTAIEEGTYVGKTWRLTTGNPIVLGTTALTFIESSGGGGTGITYTADTAPPGGAARGDLWYNTDNDVLYEYIFDGTSSYWVDTVSPVITSTSNANVIVTSTTTESFSPFLLAGM